MELHERPGSLPRGQNRPPEEVGKAGGVTGHVELFAGLARHPRVRLIEVSEYASLRDTDRRTVTGLIELLANGLACA